MSIDRSPVDKLWFLQFLRGIACLIIVYVHWISFLQTPGLVNGYIYQDSLPSYDSSVIVSEFALLMNALLPSDFREVFFGLGLFFMISGFIIPISLENSSKFGYLARRVMRILPTAIACTLLTAISIIIARFIDGSTTMPFSLKTVLANAFLIRDFMNVAYVDTAIWTLEVEVHFYLVCFAISFFGGQRRAWVLIAMALAFYVVSLLAMGDTPFLIAFKPHLSLIAMNGCFMVLMFVGMAFYNLWREHWSLNKTALIVVGLLFLNYYTLKNYYPADSVVIFINHVYAVLMFTVFWLFSSRLPYFRLIDKLANISYPLYLLHGALGYVVFYAMYKTTSIGWLSALTAAMLVYALTLLVHFTIELPSTPWGKRLAMLIDSRTTPIPNR